MGRGAVQISGVAAAVMIAISVAGCGSSTRQVIKTARPPQPIDLSAYVDNNHVSVSPDRFGGGPVRIKVTNEATGNSMTLNLVEDGKTVATSHAMGSNSTATIDANLTTGRYELTAAGKSFGAKLDVTKMRPNADNALLQP